MGRFLPDIAVTVDDKGQAAAYYQAVFGLEPGRSTEHWAELQAGPFRLYLCEGGPVANLMLAYAAEDVAAIVAKIVEAGGAEIGRNGEEVFVRDRYGAFFCIEPESG
ncbi:MAG: VOC family protein [Fimbriimonadaceae bacterium]